MARKSLYRWNGLRVRGELPKTTIPTTDESQCRGKTKAGRRCKLHGLGGGEMRYCALHQYQSDGKQETITPNHRAAFGAFAAELLRSRPTCELCHTNKSTRIDQADGGFSSPPFKEEAFRCHCTICSLAFRGVPMKTTVCEGDITRDEPLKRKKSRTNPPPKKRSRRYR